MPCYDGRRDNDTDEHNSPLAQMLCQAMRVIEEFKLESQVTQEVNAWWREHKERDENKRVIGLLDYHLKPDAK